MLGSELEMSLHGALALADERRHEYATLEHLLLALTDDADVKAVLQSCEVDLERLRTDLTGIIDGELASLVGSASGDAKPTAAFQRTLQRAAIHVQSSGAEEVTGANLLVALFSERESSALHFLQEQGVSRDKVLAVLPGSGASGKRSHRAARTVDATQDTARGAAYADNQGLLSASLQRALERALALARERRHEYATLEHLLLALTEDGHALALIEACRVDPVRLRESLRAYLDKELSHLASEQTGDPRPTAGFQRVLQRASIHVQSSGREEVTGANVVVALFSERESNAVYFLQEQDMSRIDALNYISHGILKGEQGAEHPANRMNRRRSRGPQPNAPVDPFFEYWALLKDVTLRSEAAQRRVEITGRDVFAFTRSLTPGNLAKCPVGGCRDVLVTSEEGGIVDAPLLMRLARNHVWLSGSNGNLLLWAKGVAVHAGLKVQIKQSDVSPLHLQGPKSRSEIEILFGAKVAELEPDHLRETELDGMPLVLARTDRNGELGYELFPRDDGALGESLLQCVFESAQHRGGVAVTGPPEIRRVEAGSLVYGSDMDLDTNPFEVGLERLMDLDQETAFIGKAALRRIKKMGVTRRLVGIEILGPPSPLSFEQPWPVSHEGFEVGAVTIAVRSPRLDKTIGYAMVPKKLAALGTRLSVKAPWGPAVAVVAEKSFIAPNSQ